MTETYDLGDTPVLLSLARRKRATLWATVPIAIGKSTKVAARTTHALEGGSGRFVLIRPLPAGAQGQLHVT